MIKRSAIAAIAALLLTGTVLAAPVLRSDVTVTAHVVTIGDMFADAGTIASTPLFRAPMPGTSGIVPLKDIEAAAARAGLDAFDNTGLTTVRVTRAATIVDQTLLSDLIAADLRSRGILTPAMSANTVFTTTLTTFNAEATANPATIVALRYLPGSGAFSARFTIAGIDRPIDVNGTIELMIEVPHLKGSMAAGTVLSPDNIVMRPIPLRFAESSGIARVEDLVGQALVRSARDGMALKPGDVTTPLTVAKNDLVTIYFRKGPMTLTVKGQAITSAATGGPVQVLNLMSRRVISATALATGAVEVSTDPLALAGL